MHGPRGETSSGTWEFLAIEAPRRFEVLDGLADENGEPVGGMLSQRMTFDFTSTESGTRMVAVSHIGSLEALEQTVAMGQIEEIKMAMGSSN